VLRESSKCLLKAILFFIVCVAFQLDMAGQYKNVVIEGKSAFHHYQPSEPAIAIDPTNPKNLVAGAILDKVYTSSDGGETWDISTLESQFGVYGDPCIVSGFNGDFYYFHLSNPTGAGWGSDAWLDRIVCQRSKNKGKTWNQGASIGHNGSKDQDKEWAATSPYHKRIFTTWTQFDGYHSKVAGDSSVIMFSSSNRRARKWTDPVRISDRAGDCMDDDQTVEGAVPTVGPEKDVYVAWALGESIWFDRSSDCGKTWLPSDKIVGRIAGGWNIEIPGIYRCNGMPITKCDLSGGKQHGTIYINYADQSNGIDDTDIWLLRSNDKGDTWSEPVRVNDDAAGSHQFFTWMDVDPVTGHIYIVFYDRRNYEDLRTDVYLATSTDGGMTFINEKISETPFIPDGTVFFGDYLNIAAYDGVVRPIWARHDDGLMSIWTALINK
jgi:hypothetical protein